MADYTQPDHVEKRLRYFDGQFLVVQDFVDEQKYHIDRQRRQTRLLRTSGILEGLQVTQASASAEAVSVEVAPGTAIDLKGRAIILSEKQVVDLTEHIGTTVTLAVAYVEEDSDLPTSDRGSRDLTRWHEKVAFEVVKNGETSTLDGAIDIVRITINANGNISINANHTYTNFHSGVRFGNTAFGNPEISLKPISRDRLQLTGNLTISGSLTATQDLVVQRALSFPLATRANNNHQEINFGGGEYGIGVQPDTQYFRTAKNFAWYQDGSHSNESLNPGGNGKVQMILDSDGRLGIGESNPQFKLDVAGSIRGNSLDIDGSIRGNCIGSHFVLPNPLKWFFKAQGERWTTVLRYDLSLEAECDVVVIANAHGKAPADRDPAAGITSTTAGSINCAIFFGGERIAPFNTTLSYGMGFAVNSSGTVWVPIQATASRRLPKGNHTITFRFCSNQTGTPPRANSSQVHGPAMLILLTGARKN